MKKFFTRKNRRSVALLLSLVLTLSMGMTAFAAETQPTSDMVVAQVSESTLPIPANTTAPAPSEVTSTRAASGYAATYTDSLSGSFKISVTGSSGLWGTATMRAWDFPSTAIVYVSLQKPDGSLAFSNVRLPIGQQVSKTFAGLQTGSYYLLYNVHGVDKGWIEGGIN